MRRRLDTARHSDIPRLRNTYGQKRPKSGSGATTAKSGKNEWEKGMDMRLMAICSPVILQKMDEY
eukprot:5934992-Amphidinium_carterae.1